MSPAGIEAWLPILITLATAGAFTPLIVALLRLIGQAADSISDQRVRELAKTAIHWVEATAATAPSPQKKALAVDLLVKQGVPAEAAGRLVEAAVSQLNIAAAQALAAQQTPPAAPIVNVTVPAPVLGVTNIARPPGLPEVPPVTAATVAAYAQTLMPAEPGPPLSMQDLVAAARAGLTVPPVPPAGLTEIPPSTGG